LHPLLERPLLLVRLLLLRRLSVLVTERRGG